MSPILRAVNFKEVWTTDVHVLYINPDWSISQFLQRIKFNILHEFNIDSSYDIIETGQELAENAPALQCSSIGLRDKWGDDLNVSFYIRRRMFEYTDSNLENSYVSDTCPICLESVQLISRNGCSHGVCADCNERCQQINYTICPLCRHD